MPLPPDLPLDDFVIAVGGRSWTIRAVRDQDALLGVADRFAHVPYGLLLWESSVALAQSLDTLGDALTGKTLLELGAGVGLAGMVAAARGALVLQTDHEPAVLELAAWNAQRNDVDGVAQEVADWRTWPITRRFDLVVGADVLYEPDRHADVASILATCVAANGRAVFTDPGRQQTPKFRDRLIAQGWQSTLSQMTVDDVLVAGRTVNVTVIEAYLP